VQRGLLPRLPAGAITNSRLIRLTRIHTLWDAWYEIREPRNNLAILPRKEYKSANSRLDKMPSHAKALMSIAQRGKSQRRSAATWQCAEASSDLPIILHAPLIDVGCSAQKCLKISQKRPESRESSRPGEPGTKYLYAQFA
jgi:hypothetical protein